MQITPQQVRQLAELALVLEPILDKQGCTNRYEDLENKPLVDFLVAAVNTGPGIEEYARSVLEDNNQQIFSHFAKTIEISNDYKTKKYINTGLLHFLFITIRVRLESQSLEEALNNFIPVMECKSKPDVHNLIRGFEVGWSTSNKKRGWQQEVFRSARSADSYYARQIMINKHLEDKLDSAYQTTKEAIDGFPTIRKFVEEVDENKGLIKSLEDTYSQLRASKPEIKVGVLADLAASALFLYLSFQDPTKYKIT